MRTLIKVGMLAAFFIITVFTSVVINSHYREIQEGIGNRLFSLYKNNPKLAEKISDWNKFVLNSDGFDEEARVKNLISDKFLSVVLINTIPTKGNVNQGGRGTGFFVSETDTEATIMTNYHVIDFHVKDPEGFALQVNAPTERWPYDAEVVGYDPVADIALIKIKKKEDEKFSPLEFVDPDSYREGDPVVVIGHGMGMAWSSTTGRVVYDGRGGRPYNLMVQVDAVINQGNSGGPVFDTNSRKVLGVAQSILSPARQVPGWDGVGLAVSAQHAEMVMKYFYTDAYAEEGYVPYSEYPFPINSFGFEDVKDIPREDRYYVYADYTNRVKDVVYAGEAAGIKQGDILLEINGEKVWSSYNMLKAVIYSRPGDIMKIKVLRNNPAEFEKKEIEIDVKLTEIDYQRLMQYVNGSMRGGR